MDYSLNSDMDIHFTEWGDFVTVEGIEEFQQALTVQLHDQQRILFGSTANDATLELRVKQIVTRLANQYSVIDSIDHLKVTRTNTASDTVKIIIGFNTGDSFEETL
ncbi:hypothetical protein [Halomonas sp.]|uniref:hypothetical protein n=1 Tax=Halomonas sp. TaxID=1486246 RepID=UPI003561873E